MGGSNALHQVSTIARLRAAWLYISDSKKGRQRDSAGVDNESINRFAQRADEHLQTIARQIRSSTGYGFARLKPYTEVNEKGKVRVICVPTVRDRIVQRALLDWLEQQPRYRIETEVSFGFVRGRGVGSALETALAARAKRQWVYKTDISAFFDTIDRDSVREKVRRRLALPTLQKLFSGIIDSEVQPSSNSQSRAIKRAGIRFGKGLRQGMPASPLFANLFLEEFDRAVVEQNWSMVRYADDLIFFADSEKTCLKMHAFCVDRLSQLGLDIHDLGTDKSTIVPPGEPVEFLGVNLNYDKGTYRAMIPIEKINQKKSELYKYGSLDYLLEQKMTVSRLLRKIDGKIAGWNDAYKFCANKEQLRDSLRDFRNEVLRRVFVSELGMSSLNAKSRAFLEIEN